MTVSIQYYFKPEYAIAKCLGEVSSQTEYLTVLKKLYTEIVIRDVRKFIIDERKLQILSNNLSKSKLANWLKELTSMSIARTAVAVIVQEDSLESELIFLKNYRDVGFNIEAFTSEDGANKWLLKQDIKDDSSVDIQYDLNPKFIFVKVAGEISDEDAHLDYLKEIYDTAKKEGAKRMLLDEQELQILSGIVSEMRIITWIKKIVKDDFAKGLALVVSKDRFRIDKKLGAFFREFGFNIQVFKKIEDGEKWLVKQ